MARIVGIDFGMKRTGISATDPLQIIVQAVDTVETKELYTFLEAYFAKENVEAIVFGLPKHADMTPTYVAGHIQKFSKRIEKKFPKIRIHFADEDYSSVDAKEVILKSGANKKKRRNKLLVDKISAVIILQRFLGHIP